MGSDRGAGSVESLAEEMFAEMLADGQSVRRIGDEAQAAAVREALRRLGRESRTKIRTARMDDRVVAARLDAALWTDDAATMRRKLAAPD